MKESEQPLTLNQQILAALNRAQSLFITDADSRDVFESLLEELINVTQSEYGFIAKVLNDENNQPYIKTLAITNIAWNAEMRAYYDEHVGEGLELRNINSLFGHVLTSGEAIIANDAANDSRAAGVPHGHPVLNAFLGIPIYVGSDLVGMLGVANNPEGYSQETVEMLSPLTAVCAQLIHAYKASMRRKEAEEKLAASEERYKKIFNNLQDAYYRTDSEGVNIMVSPSAAELMAGEVDQIIGTSVASHYVDEKARGKFIQALNENDGTVKNFEAQIRRIDGKVIWVSTNAHYHLDDNGNIDGVEGTIRDVSELKNAETRLKESEARFRDIFENSPDPCWIINEDNLFSICNLAAADILGYDSVEELTSTHPSKLSPEMQPDGTPSYEKANAMMSIAHAKGIHRFEWEHQRKNGECFPVEVTLSRIELDGKPQLYCTWEDISERKRVEADLQEIGRQHEEAERLAHLGHWQLDLATNQLAWSKEIYRIFELDLESFVPSYEAFLNAIHPDDRDFVSTAYEESVKNRAGYKIEHRLLMADGSIKWVIERGETTYSEEGEPLVSTGTVLDVTSQKVAEEKLRLSEERFALAMAGANDGLWDWNLETDEVYYSPRWLEMLGYEPDAFPQTLDTWATLVHPDDRAWVLQCVTDYLEGRTNSFDVEMRMQHKDGHNVFVLSRATKAVHAADGKPLRLVGTHVDITERKAQQAMLEASKRRFKEVFESSTDGIFILDMHGNFIDINKTAHERLGYTKEEMLASSVKDLDPPEFAVKVPMRMKQIMEQGVAVFETAHYRKDGSIMPVEVSARKLELDGQEVVLSIVRDISERKMFEEQLRHSQKMESIGTLVGGIAHDFNNMLAAVQGNVYLARKQIQEHPVAVDKLDNIEKLSARAANMVRQLLTFARKDIVQMNVFSLNGFMEEGYALAKAAIPENVDHQTTVCEVPLQIKGDATQLQQVLFNLLSNAVDAVAEVSSPEIRCSLKPYEADKGFYIKYPDLAAGSFACIAVKDNGIGIPNEHLDKIFEPFFTTKEVGKGTGLGLAMLYGAVQTHGGVVEVKSEPGQGTSFKVYLPLCHEDAAPENAQQTSPEEGQGETILLVDDEDDLRETTAEVLIEMGYQVLQAVNGSEALELFKSQQSEISLVLSDVIMPKMGGVQLLQAIREFDQQVPVILATGYDQNNVLDQRAMKENCQAIHKPFNFDALAQIIRGMID